MKEILSNDKRGGKRKGGDAEDDDMEGSTGIRKRIKFSKNNKANKNKKKYGGKKK